MKVSELTAELQQSLDVHGDGVVDMDTPYGREPESDVNRIEVDRYGNVTIYGE